MMRIAAALTLAVPPGAEPDADQLADKVEGKLAELASWQLRAETAETRLAKLDQAEADREVDDLIRSAYEGGQLVRKADDKGKPIADPQEASLRGIAKGLGAGALKSHIATMPVQHRPAVRRSVAEETKETRASTTTDTPESALTEADATPEMIEAARQCGVPLIDVVRNAHRAGRLG